MGWIGIEIFLNFNPIQPKFQKIRTQPNPTTHKKTNPSVGLDQVHQIARFNECTHQRRTNKRTIKLTETIENN